MMNLFGVLLRRPKRRGLPVPGNIEIFDLLPVLSVTFKRSLVHLDAIQMALQHSTLNHPKEHEWTAKHSLLFKEVESKYPVEGPVIEPIHILHSLRYHLALFISRVYTKIEQSRKEIEQGNGLMPSLLVKINGYFFDLEESVATVSPGALAFDQIQDHEEQWTDAQLEAAITLTYANVEKLETCLSMMVSKYRKPRSRKWIYFGAIGISILSVWLLRHSGISVLKAIRHFFSERVELQLISLKDEFFKTARERDNKASDVLHSMLLNYTGNKSSENTSDQEMFELVKSRFNNHINNPILAIMSGGEVLQEILIYIQKLCVYCELANNEVKCFLSDNKIYTEFLAALPTVVFSIAVIKLSRAFLKKVSMAKDKRKSKPRLLVTEVEKRINDFLRHSNQADGQGLNEMSAFLHGLTLCSLDVLYKEIEIDAYITGDWESLQQDILELGKSHHRVDTEAVKRLKSFYKCLICLKN